MGDTSFWMHVDAFTVKQAASLWCGVDPAKLSLSEAYWPSEVVAAMQMLASAIVNKQLEADTSTNALRIIGDHSASLVSRDALIRFARGKNLFPAFLFDTLSPFPEPEDATVRFDRILDNLTARIETSTATSPGLPDPVAATSNRGGRPQEYDWDSFMLEIVRRANDPDGLPATQAELVKDMLEWFVASSGREPAESAVKARVSKIYRYMNEAKNLPR